MGRSVSVPHNAVQVTYLTFDPGDDEDSSRIYERTTVKAARDQFPLDLYYETEGAGWQAAMQDVTEEYGQPVFINHVFVSDFIIEDMTNANPNN